MSTDPRLEELFHRWQDAQETGSAPSIAELCADCPELCEEFERRLRAAAELKRFVGLDEPTPSLADAVTTTGDGHRLRDTTQQGRPPANTRDYPFLAPPQAPDEIGRLGSYRILAVLGAGGMGIVFRAEEPQPRRLVALKVMKPELAADNRARRRFLEEGQSAASVEHSRVVSIFRVDQANGVPFLVMPLLKGMSLQDLLCERKKLPVTVAVRIGREMIEGLAAAHAVGLIHRDVKPGNVWLREGQTGEPVGADPAGWPVVLLDFGLARAGAGLAQSLTSSGVAVGTPGYMAPEQARGEEVDARVDLFSLGCVLYRMLTGRAAFGGQDVLAVLSSVALTVPPAAHEVEPTVPRDLSILVAQLLAKNPADRPQSATEVLTALRAVERQLPERAATRSFPAQPAVPSRTPHSRWPLAVAGVGVVAVVGLILGLVFGREHLGLGGVASSGDTSLTSAPVNVPPPPPLRVTAIDVRHFARLNGGQAVPRGVLGRDSFLGWLRDQVTIEARLSRPAYAYLVAFRPDGQSELCFPDDENQPPPLTDRPRYPSTDEKRDKRYGLAEGVGLWIFAVVASERPLPAYSTWATTRPRYWVGRTLLHCLAVHSATSAALADAATPFTSLAALARFEEAWAVEPPVGAIWWDDGQVVQELTAAGTVNRAKDEEAAGPAGVVTRVANGLRAAAQAEATAAVGFAVRSRD